MEISIKTNNILFSAQQKPQQGQIPPRQVEQFNQPQHKKQPLKKIEQTNNPNKIYTSTIGHKIYLAAIWIVTLNVACQNIIFILIDQPDFQDYYLTITISIMILFFICSSRYLANSWKQYLITCFEIDNLLLTQIVASLGYVGLHNINFNYEWNEYFSIIMVPLLHFLLCANSRLVLKNFVMKNSQIFLFKLAILLGAIVFFCIGAYIIFIDYKVTQGQDQTIDTIFKDFILLYIFGNVGFYAQILNHSAEYQDQGQRQQNKQIEEQKQLIKGLKDKVDKLQQTNEFLKNELEVLKQQMKELILISKVQGRNSTNPSSNDESLPNSIQNSADSNNSLGQNREREHLIREIDSFQVLNNSEQLRQSRWQMRRQQ